MKKTPLQRTGWFSKTEMGVPNRTGEMIDLRHHSALESTGITSGGSLMASIVTVKRRHLTVTLTYMGIEGYGKVRYRLVCASTTRTFRPPSKTSVQQLARQLGLESYREVARSNNSELEGQTLTIDCTLFAGSTREARNQFTTELHRKIKLN